MLILTADDPDAFHCPGCGLDHARVGKGEGGKLTEEHIIPQALGNVSWTIALCDVCNSRFNQRFESLFLKGSGIVRARAALSLRTRRQAPRGWTNVTRVRQPHRDLLIQQKLTPGGLERQETELHRGRLDSHFAQLPAEFSRREVISCEFEWDGIIGTQTCLKIGLEQMFFHLHTTAEDLELTKFVRAILNMSRDEFHERNADAFGRRLIQFGMEKEVPPVQIRNRVFPHTMTFVEEKKLAPHAMKAEKEQMTAFWKRGQHLLRTRIRRLEVNDGSRRIPVIHISYGFEK